MFNLGKLYLKAAMLASVRQHRGQNCMYSGMARLCSVLIPAGALILLLAVMAGQEPMLQSWQPTAICIWIAQMAATPHISITIARRRHLSIHKAATSASGRQLLMR